MDSSGPPWKGNGGETGIRTQVRVSPKHAFQACAFSHSAISPLVGCLLEFNTAGELAVRARTGRYSNSTTT